MDSSLQQLSEDIRSQEAAIQEGGGARAIERQHAKGRLTARERIEKLLDPAKATAVCEKCSDERKNQPVAGMTIIKGVKQSADDKDLFDGGEILDPNNGKVYKVRLKPADGGKKLDVRGYIGAPLLGRTQTWIRVE